jgi:hypothetical protein
VHGYFFRVSLFFSCYFCYCFFVVVFFVTNKQHGNSEAALKVIHNMFSTLCSIPDAVGSGYRMKTQAPVRTESERRRAGAGGRGVPKEQGRNWRR